MSKMQTSVEDDSKADIQIGADSTHEIIGYLYEGTEHAIPIRERRPGEPHKLTEEEKDLFRAAAIDGIVPIQDYLRIWYGVLNPEYRKPTGTN